MPSSVVSQISTIMQIVMATRPKSVLDIGVGFGKYGFLCREYLELWDGREQYGQWQHRIDGIEAFADYVLPLHNMIYDNLYVGDAREILPKLKTRYGLILMIDVIEHFSLEEGQLLLDNCQKMSDACLISTPLTCSDQGEAFGNPYETHRSQWTSEHFDRFDNKLIAPDPKSLIAYLRFDGVKVTASSTTV